MSPLIAILAVGAKTAGLYVGTYTSPGGSEGIYRLNLDLSTGALTSPELVARTANPSYLALHPNGRLLYAIDESNRGSVSAYAIEHGGALRVLNREAVPGAGPCYLSVDPSGHLVLVASYGHGYVSALPIAADGSLGTVQASLETHGTGPNRDRQDRSHMHWIVADPRHRMVYACDLGADRIRAYRFDRAMTEFVPAASGDGLLPGGAGPRHGAFGKSRRFLYVDNEMDDSVCVFEVDKATGALTLRQTLSALPGGEPKPGVSAAEIECHPNGRFVYVSNRGDDSITVFRVGRDGVLEVAQIEPVHVRMPRGFAIDPSGHWLVVAGQDSNDIAVLPVDPHSGRLGPAVSKVSLAAPVCVLFGGTS